MDKEARIQEAYNRVVEYMSELPPGFHVYGLESDESYIDADIVMDVVDKLNENGYQTKYRLGWSYYYTALEIFKPVEDKEEPMVDIISANEASKIAHKHVNSDKIVEDFLDMANAVIKDYANQGRYNTELCCIEANKAYVYDRIKEILTAKGYTVVLKYPFIKIKW